MGAFGGCPRPLQATPNGWPASCRRHFEATLILQAVSWYLRYPLERRLRHFRKPVVVRSGSMKPRSSLFYWVLVVIVPFPRVLAFLGAEVELRGEGVLANLVSGETASTPRSHVRVGGAPRRAAPLYISGAVRQPTSRHGHRSLGPTGPAPPGGSGPIRLSASAGAPPACILPPCRCKRLSVRPASAPSPAARRRPGGVARARSGAFAPGRPS